LPECPKRTQPVMDGALQGLADLTTHLPRRRVGRDALLPHQRGELLAPLPQCRLADVEALAWLEDRCA